MEKVKQKLAYKPKLRIALPVVEVKEEIEEEEVSLPVLSEVEDIPKEEPAIPIPPKEEEESKMLPKLRIKADEGTEKVKQFATAQGLSMYMKVTKAKKASLTALHKVATWLTPKNKKL